MSLENVDIYKLVPEEIKNLIEKLEQALLVVSNRKNTTSIVIEKELDKIICPHCSSSYIVKNGHDKNKVQTYKCKNCNKRFNILTNTIFANSRLNMKQIEIFFDCMNNKRSIRATAKLMNVSTCTVFTLRHKVLDTLSTLRKTKKLTGEVQSDEYYTSINLKGLKRNKMPRFSKPRATKGGSKRGISNHQVCVASAKDENDKCFFEVVGTGPITSKMVESTLVPKLKNIKCLITDCKSSYESVAKINKWKLIQIKSEYHTDEYGNSLAEINSLHSNLSTFLSVFRGVSTKHLQHYLDWFSFEKELNYTIDIIKHSITFMKTTMIHNTNINYKNVYNNDSGIDFNAVYSDLNFTPSLTN